MSAALRGEDGILDFGFLFFFFQIIMTVDNQSTDEHMSIKVVQTRMPTGHSPAVGGVCKHVKMTLPFEMT